MLDYSLHHTIPDIRYLLLHIDINNLVEKQIGNINKQCTHYTAVNVTLPPSDTFVTLLVLCLYRAPPVALAHGAPQPQWPDGSEVVPAPRWPGLLPTLAPSPAQLETHKSPGTSKLPPIKW